MVRRGSECALATVAVATLLLAGCGADEQPPSSRMALDDGALPVGAGGPQLSPGFDRSTNELTKALPVQQLQAAYTELVPMASESLVPSEATGCNPDAVLLPSLPATEVLATRPPAFGAHEPEVASVVAARAPSEKEAADLLGAVRKAAAECENFSSQLKDLGEGSVAPGEKGTSTTEDATIGDDWSGLRVRTSVAVAGRNWQQDVVRESLVIRKGQVVVHVHAEQSEKSETSSRVDALSTALITAIDGQGVAAVTATAPADQRAATPTAPAAATGIRPSGQPAGRTRTATPAATATSRTQTSTGEPTRAVTASPPITSPPTATAGDGDGDGAVPVP